MKLQVIVTPEAEQEMTEAVRWYEDRVTGLGHEFLLSMDSLLVAITQSPLQFPLVYRNIRRALMRRFPYELFFVLKVIVSLFWPCISPSVIQKSGNNGQTTLK